jgi:hypothetical protein
MRKYLLLLFIAGIFQNIKAQISIQPILPLAGMVQKNNLWNVAVINTSAGVFDCRLELTLRDRLSGLEVLTGTTGLFQIMPGAKQLNAAILQPIQYNYLSSNVTNRTDDFIPVGNYTVCYRLTSNIKTLIAEECVAFDVEPLSPPMLILPADSAVLDVAPSQFSWIPPAPLNLFSRLTYEVIVTEIQPGQKANEAIQNNLPFYTEPNLTINNLAYTNAAASFEKDKWYAWQIVAKDDRNYAAKSEVWVFQISKNETKKELTNKFYLQMQDEVKGTYKITENKLHIKYTSLQAPFETEIIFTNEKGSVVKKVNQKIVQGDNYIDFTLGNQFKENKVYTVTIQDYNKKSLSITFSINTK